ncbi:MAG: MerR family transcriptional regulator [Microbacterium sp.]|nr:MerR family transcriptional regulator [Microbacterium sp.]
MTMIAPASDSPHSPMKEMVLRSGLSEHTLRYYERIGLLGRIARDRSSRHRYYSESDAVKVVTLACLRATGMSIEQMRRYVSQNDAGVSAAADQIALFDQHREFLQRQITRAQHQLEYLDGKVAYWNALSRGDGESASKIGWKNFEMALEINNEMKEEQA